MQGNWKMKATIPGDDLSVIITVQHPDLGEYFCAILRAQRVSSSKVPYHMLFFWLMPHKVAVWIYWHVSDTFPLETTFFCTLSLYYLILLFKLFKDESSTNFGFRQVIPITVSWS